MSSINYAINKKLNIAFDIGKIDDNDIDTEDIIDLSEVQDVVNDEGFNADEKIGILKHTMRRSMIWSSEELFVSMFLKNYKGWEIISEYDLPKDTMIISKWWN